MGGLKSLAAAALCALFGTASALAQNNPPAQQGSPEALAAIYACANNHNDAERLACYDAAVSRLHTAEASGQVVAIDREQATRLQHESFGFNLPSITRLLPNFNGQPSSLTRIESQLTSVSDRGQGYHTYRLANGQTWVDIEPTGAGWRVGDAVVVRQASFGSFLMTSTRVVGARRVRRQE